MLSLSSGRLSSETIVLSVMLMTSLGQPTHDEDQSASEKCDDRRVTGQLEGVSGQLAALRDDVMRRAPAASVCNCRCDGGNLTQLHADVAAIRASVVESTDGRDSASANRSSDGKYFNSRGAERLSTMHEMN